MGTLSTGQREMKMSIVCSVKIADLGTRMLFCFFTEVNTIKFTNLSGMAL